MKKELHLLRQLMQQALTPSTNLTGSEAAPLANGYCSDLVQIREAMIEQLQELTLSKKPQRLIKRKIRHTQKECISMLDRLPGANQVMPPQQLVADKMKHCLEEVLGHLHQHNSYFNCDVYAPVIEIQRITDKTYQKMTVMKAALRRKNIYSELLNIIYAAFERFNLGRRHTYQHLHYMAALQLSILKLCEKVSNLDFDYLLLEHLTYWGFNECIFMDYCKGLIRKMLQPHYGTGKYYERLCSLEKRLIVQQEKAGFRYSLQRQGVKDQLLLLIRTELSCLEKKQHYYLNGHGAVIPVLPASSTYRIKTSLSVEALACLLRLFCEGGIIEAEPRSQLLAFAALHFQTPRLGEQQLSASSLATKYKQVTTRTAQSIKAKLIKLCQKVDEEFGSEK